MNLIEDTKIDRRRGDPAPVDLVALSDGAGFFNEVRKVDMDGDGLLHIDRGAPRTTSSTWAPSKPVDLDGDGSMELVAVINVGCPVSDPATSAGCPTSGVAGSRSGHGARYGVLAWDPAKRTLTRRLLRGARRLRRADTRSSSSSTSTATSSRSSWRPSVGNGPWCANARDPGDLAGLGGQPEGQAAGLPQVAYGTRRGTAAEELPGPFHAGRYRRPTDIGDGRRWGRPLRADAARERRHRYARTAGWGRWAPACGRGSRIPGHWSANRDEVIARRLPSQRDLSVTVDRRPPTPDSEPGLHLGRFADVNGDGLKDAFYREGGTEIRTWEVRPNTGAGYGPARPLGSGCLPRAVGDQRVSRRQPRRRPRDAKGGGQRPARRRHQRRRPGRPDPASAPRRG